VVRPVDGSAPARALVPTTKGITLSWAKDSRHYAYTKEKSVYIGSVDDQAPKQMTGSSFVWAPEGLAYAYMNGDDKIVVGRYGEAEKTFTVSLPPRATDPRRRTRRRGEGQAGEDRAQTSATEQVGQLGGAGEPRRPVDARHAERATDVFVKYPPEETEAPTVSVSFWTQDEKALYYVVSSTVKWDRSLMRYEPALKRSAVVKHDDAERYAAFRLSKDGSTPSTPWRTAICRRLLCDRSRLVEPAPADRCQSVDARPQVGDVGAVRVPRRQRKKLKGVVYYPVDYQPGKAYPTVFEVYETMFADRFSDLVAYLNANGYVVAMPSVYLEMGWPVEAGRKG